MPGARAGAGAAAALRGLGRLDIDLDDAAVRPRPLEATDVDAALLGEAAGQRRGEDPPVARIAARRGGGLRAPAPPFAA